LSSTVAFAQSSRAGGPAFGGDDPTTHIGIEAALSGNIARGFTDRELITARGIVEVSTGKWGFYTQPYWLFARVNLGPAIGKITTDNEIYERTGLFRRITGPVFAYGVTVFDRSVRRKIEGRNLTGAGLGANLWQCKGNILLTSVGLLYEYADYGFKNMDELMLVDGTTRDVNKTGRWSVRIYGRFKIAGGKLGLIQDIIMVPSLSDPEGDYRLLTYSAIDAPIAKGFSVRAQADYTREKLIVAGTKRDDLAITFGIAYKNEWPPKKPPPPPK
jgi:hypothetical protein